MTKKTTADVFRESAREVPAFKARQAREEANVLVDSMLKQCIEAARVAAVDNGYLSTTCQLDPPMVSGNLVPRQHMVEELVALLEQEGFEVTAVVEPAYRTNLNKLFVTMDWS